MPDDVAAVLAGERRWACVESDAVAFLRSLPKGSVSLVFGSPPYSQARLYLEGGKDLGIARDAEAWAAWMKDVVLAALHACDGLVAFVVEGQTKNYRYNCAPALLMADLHRAGVCLRKPPVYHRVGICGSGGPDWLRSDTEYIVCATNGGRLPWSNNVAMGHPPKYAPGGEMSHRTADGQRINQWGMRIRKDGGLTATERNSGREGQGDQLRRRSTKPSHQVVTVPSTKRRATAEGDVMERQEYVPPAIANPGNVIYEASEFVHCNAGGGQLGNPIAHKNEAPFGEDLATFFIRSFCPPGGVCVDPFAGSGTTLAVAVREGRRALGCDLRASQVALTSKRCGGETPPLFAEEP